MNTREIVLNLEYFPTERTAERNATSSGIGNVDVDLLLQELKVGISEDSQFDWELDQFVNSGKHQINIRGTKKAFFELGKLLIALSVHPDADSSYHLHLDSVTNENEEYQSHIIIHAPDD